MYSLDGGITGETAELTFDTHWLLNYISGSVPEVDLSAMPPLMKMNCSRYRT